MKKIIFACLLSASLYANAQDAKYVVTFLAEPASEWNGERSFTAETSKKERLVIVIGSGAPKTALLTEFSSVDFHTVSTSDGTSIQFPVRTYSKNQCAIAQGESCVAVGSDGRQIYSIHRIQ